MLGDSLYCILFVDEIIEIKPVSHNVNVHLFIPKMFIRVPGEQCNMSSKKTKSLVPWNLDVCIIYLSPYIHFDLSVSVSLSTHAHTHTHTHTQLTLLQHVVEPHRSTYAQIFFSSKHYTTAWPAIGWICGHRGRTDTEGTGYKLYLDYLPCCSRVICVFVCVCIHVHVCMHLYLCIYMPF